MRLDLSQDTFCRLKAAKGGRHRPAPPAPPDRAVKAGLPKNLDRPDADGVAAGRESLDQVRHDLLECRINAPHATAFLRLATKDPAGLDAAMTAIDVIRRWVQENTEATGLSLAAWARLANLSPSTLQRAMHPEYPFVPSTRTLAALAAAINVPPPGLAAAVEPAQLGAFHLPIRYEVGAGIWRAVEDRDHALGTAPVLPEPAYAGFSQWMERVVTDSMDRDYPVGSLLHVVDAIEIGYAPRSGDHVIIERARRGGGLVERTVKEIQMTPRGPEFWPRSHNPRWSEPIRLAETGEEDDTIVEIKGLVLGSYRRRAG